MPKLALTDDSARSIPPPRGKNSRKEILDKEVRGLMLRITGNDARSWSLLYRVKDEGGIGKRGTPKRGPQRRITLGYLDELSVADARDKALELKRDIVKGVDPRPRLRKVAEDRLVNTVEALAKRVVDQQKIDTPKSWKALEHILRNHVLPTLGSKPITEVTLVDVGALLDDLKAKNSVAIAREARKHLGRVFNFALDRGIIAKSPMADMRRGDLSYRPRKRYLEKAELRAAWLAADSMDYPYGPALKLLILTGQRRQEILGAEWDRIDAKRRTLFIPAAMYKTDHDHYITLSKAAWKIIAKLPREDDSEFLFLGRTGKVARFNSTDADKWRELTEAQYRKHNPKAKPMDPWVLHDLRRTHKTFLAEFGVPKDIRAAIHGHDQEGMEATYNHAKYAGPKMEAMEKFAALIADAVK